MLKTKSKYLGMAMFVLISLGILAVISYGALAAPSIDKDKVAEKLVADQNKLPANSKLEVVNSAQTEYPSLGKTAFQYKVADSKTGVVYSIAFGDDGKEVNIEELASKEYAAKIAKSGKVEQALSEKMKGVPANEPIQVVVWLNEPSYTPPERPIVEGKPISDTQKDVDTGMDAKVIEEQNAFLEKVDAKRAAAVEPVVKPVVEKLKKQGLTVDADKYAPALFVSMDSKKIKEVANWPEVDQVYLSPVSKETLNVARPTIFADVVYNRKIAGWGVKVGEIEVGGQAQSLNPYLNWPPFVNDPIGSCLSSHSTYVAGILKSTNPTYFGMSPGINLRVGGSCFGFFNELAGAESRAADWGAWVLTNSWGSTVANGQLTVMDRFMDNMVLNRFRNVIVSAGNEGQFSGYVTSPALAYNIISVGAFNDMNTISWFDDTMSAFSSWRDPISSHGDREKPEVSGPGQGIISTLIASPWVGIYGSASGTSYSAPMVASEAALLINRNSGLITWPEPTKAIIMATAVHNIEGSSRLSEFDGAGGVVFDRADSVAQRYSGGSWGPVFYSCSAPSDLDVTTMFLTAGFRTRVVIAWDTPSEPIWFDYQNRPSADLDLYVVNPTGNNVATSLSFDNTYEIVDFTPTVTGTYKLRVHKFRCNQDPRYLGWAWRIGS